MDELSHTNAVYEAVFNRVMTARAELLAKAGHTNRIHGKIVGEVLMVAAREAAEAAMSGGRATREVVTDYYLSTDCTFAELTKRFNRSKSVCVTVRREVIARAEAAGIFGADHQSTDWLRFRLREAKTDSRSRSHITTTTEGQPPVGSGQMS